MIRIIKLMRRYRPPALRGLRIRAVRDHSEIGRARRATRVGERRGHERAHLGAIRKLARLGSRLGAFERPVRYRLLPHIVDEEGVCRHNRSLEPAESGILYRLCPLPQGSLEPAEPGILYRLLVDERHVAASEMTSRLHVTTASARPNTPRPSLGGPRPSWRLASGARDSTRVGGVRVDRGRVGVDRGRVGRTRLLLLLLLLLLRGGGGRQLARKPTERNHRRALCPCLLFALETALLGHAPLPLRKL